MSRILAVAVWFAAAVLPWQVVGQTTVEKKPPVTSGSRPVLAGVNTCTGVLTPQAGINLSYTCQVHAVTAPYTDSYSHGPVTSLVFVFIPQDTSGEPIVSGTFQIPGTVTSGTFTQDSPYIKAALTAVLSDYRIAELSRQAPSRSPGVMEVWGMSVPPGQGLTATSFQLSLTRLSGGLAVAGAGDAGPTTLYSGAQGTLTATLNNVAGTSAVAPMRLTVTFATSP